MALGKNRAVWLLVGRSTVEFAASPFRLEPAGPASRESEVAMLLSAAVIVALTSLWLVRSAGGWREVVSRAGQREFSTAATG